MIASEVLNLALALPLTRSKQWNTEKKSVYRKVKGICSGGRKGEKRREEAESERENEGEEAKTVFSAHAVSALCVPGCKTREEREREKKSAADALQR